MTTWGNQRARGTHTAGAGAAAAMLAVLTSAGLAAVGPSASAAGTGSPTASSLRRLATPLTPRGHEVPAKVVRGAVPTAAGKGYSTLGASPVGKAGPVALPTFSNTFTWNGDLYPYRMVGRSPAGSASRRSRGARSVSRRSPAASGSLRRRVVRSARRRSRVASVSRRSPAASGSRRSRGATVRPRSRAASGSRRSRPAAPRSGRRSGRSRRWSWG